MKVLKKGLAITLAAAMVLTMAPSNADAAKKVKLSKSTASIKVGGSLKLSVKNAKKSAKVTWKSSKTKVAKVSKKTTKGTASNTVKGIKSGKAVITATVKTGKKKNVLKCTVTVTNKTSVTQTAAPTAPIASATATATTAAVPTATATATAVSGTPTAKPTKGPTGTPKPTPSPTPTAMPAGNDDDFEEVSTASALRLDNSTYVTNDGCGSGKYDETLDRIEINDGSAGDLSQGSWAMPENVTIAEGDVITFRVQGYFMGTQTFRFWVGTATGGGCTPVALVNQVEEGAEVREDIGYPCELDADGNVLTPSNRGDVADKVTANQVALNADLDKNGLFDVTFKLKAGTSQLDTNGDFSRFTLKGIHGNYIDGLVIKNVYIMDVNGNPVVSEDDNKDDEPSEVVTTSALDVDLSTAEAGSGNASYNTETSKLVVNDNSGESVVYLDLPKEITAGQSVKVLVKGTYAGDTGFRFWIGDGPGSLSKDVKVFSADFKNGEFEEVFTLEATGTCTKLTIKGVATWAGGKGYIGGLEIEKIAIEYPEAE